MSGGCSGPEDPEGWARFVRVGRVTARRLTKPLSWPTSSGEIMRAKAGDWIVSDMTGGTRSVTDTSFRASYRQLAGDSWERTGRVLARPARVGERLSSQEGPAVAVSGDWRVRDEAGAEWFVPDSHFRTSYRQVVDS